MWNLLDSIRNVLPTLDNAVVTGSAVFCFIVNVFICMATKKKLAYLAKVEKSYTKKIRFL